MLGQKVVRFPCFLYSLRGRHAGKIDSQESAHHPQGGSHAYFDVSTDGTSITLKPLQPSRLDEVRAKLESLGITEQDITDAIAWARQSQ